MKHLAFPHGSASGGPGTFQNHLISLITDYDWDTFEPGQLSGADALMVVLGTRRIGLLLNAKRRGLPIIHRLDGINWQHRHLDVGFRLRVEQEFRNWLMRMIRDCFAREVVYQSQYVQDCWHRDYGKAPCPETIIYNGTDLDIFQPKSEAINAANLQLLCVEGTVEVTDSMLALLKAISREFVETGRLQKITLAGLVPERYLPALNAIEGLELLGVLSRDEMPALYRSADLFFCLELNPPCPNSVVEALASGLPVCGYDTGALRELVGDEAGSLADYGGDPLKGDKPIVANALESLAHILENLESMRAAARARAEAMFNRKDMCAQYVNVIENACR